MVPHICIVDKVGAHSPFIPNGPNEDSVEVFTPRYPVPNYDSEWYLAERLFCSINDTILAMIRQVDEVGTVSRDPYDKLRMVFRLDLSIT